MLKIGLNLLKLNYSNKLLVGTLVLIVISSSFGNAFANNGVRDEFTTGRYSFADPNGQGARETAPTDERYRPYSSSENTIIQSPNVSAAGVEASLLNGCNCVVFRLDDIQDYWLSDVQVAVMDQFVQKDQFLSAGPIVGLFGADATVVDKVIAGYNSGLFEIFAHGWDHVDYTTLTLATQTSTLQDSQNKLQLLFGSPSSVFIPPFNTFNANTLTALQDTGFNIISSAEWADSYPYFIADGASDIVDSNGIYHLPESIAFTDWIDGVPVRVPNSQILAAIDSSISTKGYAIVTLHSQEFAQVQGGTQINVVDQTLLNDLNSIIDGVIAKNYPIRTFSQVVEFNQSLPDTEPPVIAAHSDVNAAATSPSGATVSYTSPTTTDNVDAPGVATCSPLSGTTFAIGITTVTCNATDAAGNSAIPTTFNVIVSDIPASTVLFSDDFESGFAKWTETGEGDWNLESPTEVQVPGHSSNLVAHSDNCDSTCTITMSNSLDLGSYSGATLSFWRYVDKDLDNGEYLKVELYDGSQWNTIYNWTNNAGDDDTWHQETVNLDSYLGVSNFNLRFVTHESHQKEIVEVDDIEIVGLF